jgi:hypothetical protein
MEMRALSAFEEKDDDMTMVRRCTENRHFHRAMLLVAANNIDLVMTLHIIVTRYSAAAMKGVSFGVNAPLSH